METVRPKSFKEFWPYYVCEHSHPQNRLFHFIGSSAAPVFLALGFVTESPWFFALMPLAGYGMAWIGHFYFEHNKPATFKAPLYSLVGDYKMWVWMFRGKMLNEVERCRQVTAGRRL